MDRQHYTWNLSAAGNKLNLSRRTVLWPPALPPPDLRWIKAGLMVFLLAGLALPLFGGETGVLPYKTVASVYEGFAPFKAKDKLRFSVKIVPANGAIPAKPITLEIRSRQGILPVKLAADGELLDFPLTPELRAENPPIASNQPKGTLSLEAGIDIGYPGKLAERAQWYADALQDVNTVVKRQAGLMSFAAPKVKTLVFHFAPGTSAFAKLQTGKDEKLFNADEKGCVRVELRPNSDFKNTLLVLSAEPKSISPE